MPSSDKRALVSGGAGFIGSHLVDALLAAGYRAVVADDMSTGREANLPSAAELEIVDVRQPAAARLVRRLRPSVILHQAAQMDVRRSTTEPALDAEVNILGTLNLLAAAVESGTEQFVFASTGGAIYGEQGRFPADEDHPCRPLSPYGVSKLAGERYLDYYATSYGLSATCLRYANVYGERQNPHGEAGVVAIFLERLLGGAPCTIHGDGLQTRDYVHVADVVRANMAVLGASGFRVYNVGTGVETSVLDLLQKLRDLVDSQSPVRHGPAKLGEQRRSVVDARRLRQDFSLPEPTPLEFGLARTAGWFERQLAASKLVS